MKIGFAILENFGGLWINSAAIISDALQDLGNSLYLGLAWYFKKVAKRPYNRTAASGDTEV